MTIKPRVLILHATGTNRDREALQACELAGGQAEIVHVNQLRDRSRRLIDYQMLVLPGGFSYGDDLGAGKLLATDLKYVLRDQAGPFIETGKPVIGICNGFQALVKSGWLPGQLPGEVPGVTRGEPQGTSATLTRNASNRFECRWVWLQPNPNSPCVFTQGLDEWIYCPVAHGEGRFVPRSDAVLDALRENEMIAVQYMAPPDSGTSAGIPAGYPHNPNGSVADIAGICNASGTVLGLMPHPEDHIFAEQHPRWTRGERGNLGLALFENGIRYAGSC